MKIYLVGGAVRDSLLNLPTIDKDWVVVGANPEQLIKQGYQQVGRDFPVFLHPETKEEYALARTERKSGKGYTGFICDFGKEITLEQDLIRRDLTINAIAQDQKNQIIDPYHGVDDINNRILRHISPAFREDPLRVLRVARFAARFHHLGFSIAPETIKLMQEIVISGEIVSLTPERVWKETEKALSTQNPDIYFATLKTCGALAILFPQLDTLFEYPSTFYVNLGVYSFKSLKQATLLTKQPEIRFAALCHQFATAFGDNQEQEINTLCDNIKIPNDYRKIATMGIRHCNSINDIETLSADKILSIFNNIDVWRNPQHLQQLLLIGEASFKTNPKNQNVDYFMSEHLNNAYIIVKSISVSEIIAQGFKGKDIHRELQRLRLNALIDCQITKS